jgi:hypothetical protein
VILSYQQALTPVFRYLMPVFAIGLVLAFLLPEKRLAATHEEMGAGGAAADAEPAGEFARA